MTDRHECRWLPSDWMEEEKKHPIFDKLYENYTSVTTFSEVSKLQINRIV